MLAFALASLVVMLGAWDSSVVSIVRSSCVVVDDDDMLVVVVAAVVVVIVAVVVAGIVVAIGKFSVSSYSISSFVGVFSGASWWGCNI